MATIKDIARLSGVGQTTVSRVLNGSKNVSKATHDKVLEIVKKLNYKPNAAARYLKRGDFSLNTIGIIMPKIIHPFWYEILKGIHVSLQKRNYNLQIFNVDNNPGEVIRYVSEERLAGVIIFAYPLTNEIKEMFQVTNTEYLFIDHYDNDDLSIYYNNKYGGELAASYLLSKKCKKIIYIGDLEKHIVQADRLKGFKEKLLKNNIELTAEKYVSLDTKDAYQLTKELITKQKIDGIFYFCDQIAYDGLKAIKDMKKKVNIIGYDDMPASDYLGLTTIKQPTFLVGKKATEKLFKIINGDAKKQKSIRIKPELIIRNT